MANPLEIVMGHQPGASLKIRAAESVSEVQRVRGNILRGRLPSWRRVVVMTTADGGSRRAFVLEPGPQENAIEHGPFSVRGCFVVKAKFNSARGADEAWKGTAVE